MKKVIAIIFGIVLMFAVFSAVSAEDKFVHPGLLHTQEDLDRIAAAVLSGEQPYVDGWEALKANEYSQIVAPFYRRGS